MTIHDDEHDSRTLTGGEIVHLLKEPAGKWEIRKYECRQNVLVVGPSGALVFEYLEYFPKNWKYKVFNTSDEAVDFVQQEIRAGRVPSNTKNLQ